MDPPRTPARSDKKVGSYIQELNLKWHLLLPTGKYSPSPGTGVQPDEEVEAQKCVHYIRLLYFRDRIALDRVIKNFDDVLRDSALSNGWVYKPNQEYNTLPRRSVAPTDSFLGRSDPSWPNRNMLMQRLLNFLQSEAEPLAARIRSAPSISRVSTTATIGTNSPTIDQASPEGPVRSGRGRTPELHHVTAAGKRSKQVEQDHHFGSMPGPSRRRLSGMSVARSNGGSGNPGYSGPPSDVYRNLYPPLEGNIPSTGTGRVVAEVHSKNECTHLGDLWDAPAKSNGKVTTRAPCSEGPGYISTEERQRQIFSTTFRRDLSRNATNIALVGRTGKRKTWLYDEQGKEDASEDEEFFTSRESPPSPSLDYESRRQRKARRRANVEFSSKSEDWVPVYLPSSPSRKASTELVRSRKRSSMDPTMPRHRNSPRARPNEEGSPYLVKVNTYLVQDHRSRPSFQPRNLPAVPPFPRAPSANASFTTNTDTSFTESIFSDAHNEQQSQTTHGGSFSHQRLAADGHSFTRETEVALDDDDVTTDDEDVEMALREWWGEDFEMPLPADRGTQRSPNLSQGLDGMAIQSPEKATLPSFTNEDHPAGSAAIGLASSRVGNTLTVHGLEERLIKHCPFAQNMPEGLNRCSLQVRYEISRVALECSIPINELSAPSPIPDEYGEMWSWLQRICQRRGKSPPERSNAKAWELANGQFENVALTGDLSFNTSKRNLSSTNDDPIFLFRLNPLKVESSCRLFRRFGSDRFIVISLPVMSSLPTRWKVDRNAFRESILNWLVKGRHKFLGREWKAFYLKYSKRKGDSSTTNKWLIYFFAIDGCDFHEGTKPPAKGEPVGKHSRMELGEMLEWFMPFTPNQGKPCCKAFARLQLAVSQTRSTLVFRPEEIIRVPDILGDTAAGSTERKVMNDGCSRISRPAARAIAEMLCISGATPSAFQGRIAGAKGLWMVDPSEDPSPTVDNRGFWIEITDSQLKFEGHSIDLYQPDNDRVTIEINSWSQPLKAASLNFQLIPILECQGVPRDVIKKRLEEDLKSRISGLMESLEDPVAFRKWNHDANGSANERLRNQGVQFLGGLPASETEQINWFLESGFDPGTCAFLRNLAWKLAMGYCDRLKKKMHIGVGQSTYAFCLADPLGVLEEGEVHFGFSTTFRDPGSSFEDTMLHGIDVLVARLPAALPSDVQKVRAVFKPELRLLKDVIVFSTKGSTPLADKLSGGDYDGDRVWVCWDPEFVRDFENAPVPEQKPLQQRLEYYGISQDKLRLADLPKDLDERTTQFIYRGFQAELGEGMLGICTQFHEKFCYRDNSINTPGAVDLAILLGLLVDSAKQGYVFSEDSWICFRRKISPQVPLKPAYQENDESIQTDHIIDHLVFQVAKPTVDNVLTEFNARFPEQNTRDGDLVRLWREEKESSKQDKKLQRVLSRLEEDIRGIGDFWAIYPRSSNFTDRVSRAYTKFNDIMPMDIDHPLVRRWSEDANRSPVSHWRLLRASAIIGKYTKVAWWVAGRELGQLKAMASGGFHMVVTPIHASYKPDSNYVRKANIGRLTGVDVEVESVMGDEWEGEFESVFEYGDWPDEVCEAREPFW